MKNKNLLSKDGNSYNTSGSIKNWPEDERPREKLLKFGPESLTNAELIAVIIGTGINNGHCRHSAIDLAKNIILKFENLKTLVDTSFNELTSLVNRDRYVKSNSDNCSIRTRKKSIISTEWK
ncbi:MAG: hypothetical protein M1308_12625 [Actinobacteria bacterium]|nr:hypothetical protein [Actinomycetota bacterium]